MDRRELAGTEETGPDRPDQHQQQPCSAEDGVGGWGRLLLLGQVSKVGWSCIDAHQEEMIEWETTTRGSIQK